MPGDFRCDLTNACASLTTIAHAAIGRIGRPAFPAPSERRAGSGQQNSGKPCRENAKSYVDVIARSEPVRRSSKSEGGSDEAIQPFPCAAKKWIASLALATTVSMCQPLRSPPPTRSCAWWGGVGGGGSISRRRGCGVRGAAPHPDPPHRFAGGGRNFCRRDGGLFDNRICVRANARYLSPCGRA